jgi:putative solute:sodium symporter small subunit
MADNKSELTDENRHLYWHKNVKCMLVLLSVWFLVSFGCGILWVEQLNKIRIGGFKLGFWFAQQGSIYVFVILIAVYVVYMNKLDHRFNVDEDDDDAPLASENADDKAAADDA